MRTIRRKALAVSAIFVAAIALGVWLGMELGSSRAPVSEWAVPASAREGVARQAETEGSFYSDDSPIIRVVDRVKDAVVNISAEGESGANERLREEWFAPFFHPPTGRTQSFGSGFFIKADGTILTNAHVVADADEIKVRLSDEHEYDAELLGIDRETDLAVLKVKIDKPVPFIELGDSEHLRIGQWVVAIGNPFPQQRLDRTVTVGVVSGVGRSMLNFGEETPRYQNYIQTDAAINPGNSGGPLVSLDGKAVGVNAAIASPSGGNVGIGFAIPVAYVRAVLPDLIAEGKVSRGWLGISPGEITPDLSEALGLTKKEGVVVQEVLPNTPAERYGLKQGDVIVRFNEVPIVDVQQFMFEVGQTKPNTSANVEVVRDDGPHKMSVMLAERTDAQLASTRPTVREEPNTWLGMTVATSTRELAERYSVDYEPGVIVTDVEPGSEADEKGIMRGNIITSVAREQVRSLEDFGRVRAELGNRDKPVLFLIVDNRGQSRFLGLRTR
jgi:serine protease Do